MIVKNYACNICKEKLENVDELIGLFFDLADCKFLKVTVEKTDIHICSHCLEELTALHNNIEVEKAKEKEQEFNGKMMFRYTTTETE